MRKLDLNGVDQARQFRFEMILTFIIKNQKNLKN